MFSSSSTYFWNTPPSSTGRSRSGHSPGQDQIKYDREKQILNGDEKQIQTWRVVEPPEFLRELVAIDLAEGPPEWIAVPRTKLWGYR